MQKIDVATLKSRLHEELAAAQLYEEIPSNSGVQLRLCRIRDGHLVEPDHRDRGGSRSGFSDLGDPMRVQVVPQQGR